MYVCMYVAVCVANHFIIIMVFIYVVVANSCCFEFCKIYLTIFHRLAILLFYTKFYKNLYVYIYIRINLPMKFEKLTYSFNDILTH